MPKLHKDVRLEWHGSNGDYHYLVNDFRLDVAKFRQNEPRWIATLTMHDRYPVVKIDFLKTRDQAMLAIERAFANYLAQYVAVHKKLTEDRNE